MKITRSDLKALILESIRENESILLEMPHSIVGQEQQGDYTKDPDEYGGEMARRNLFHLAQQATQLHDMLKGDENLEPSVEEKITKAAAHIESAFKMIVYDLQHPEGR